MTRPIISSYCSYIAYTSFTLLFSYYNYYILISHWHVEVSLRDVFLSCFSTCGDITLQLLQRNRDKLIRDM